MLMSLNIDLVNLRVVVSNDPGGRIYRGLYMRNRATSEGPYFSLVNSKTWKDHITTTQHRDLALKAAFSAARF